MVNPALRIADDCIVVNSCLKTTDVYSSMNNKAWGYQVNNIVQS